MKICKTKAPTTTAGEKGGPGRESRILVAVARTRRPSSYTHRVSMLKWGSVIPGSGQRYSGGLRDGGGDTVTPAAQRQRGRLRGEAPADPMCALSKAE